MAYKQEKGGDIIISGFENGIAESPYLGISDMKNVQLVSVPKEASVNFSTSVISPPVIANGSVSSANAGTKYLTYTGAANLENYMTIVFSVQSGLGVMINTAYWVANVGGAGAGTFQIYSDYAQSALVAVTNGTGTFSVAQISVNPIQGMGSGQPKYFAYDTYDGAYFVLTGNGDLWSNIKTTTSGYWTYTGPSGTTVGLGQGQGAGYYQSSDGTKRYIFVMRNTTIDYFNIVSLDWTYGWIPSTAQIQQTTQTLFNSPTGHAMLNAYNNILYWCDGIFIEELYEIPGATFDPTVNPTGGNPTYVYVANRLLPSTDSSQSLAFLGTNLLIGGQNNIVYSWDTTSPSFNNYFYVAEYNIPQMITVNTNTYIFAGNRGRIYITNGSQAQIFKKIPDFLSGTVEPYFTWGGVCSVKNQLYFGFKATTNSGTVLNTYGGVWGIDLDTKAIRMTNTLSYQTTTYQGYVLALIPNFATNPAGVGLYIAWENSSNSLRGIDTTTSAPYVGGTTVAVGIVNSDLIPIGTFLKPTTNGRVEFKLAVPLATNESVQLFYRQKLSDDFMTKTVSSGPVGPAITTATQGFNGYSWAYTSVNFQNSQWIQIQAKLTSTATNPSYCRLTELRIGNN